MKRKYSFIGAVIVLILLIGLVAMMSHNNGSKTNQTSSSANVQNAVQTNQVNIQNYMFMPESIKVKAGTQVTWTNKDSVNHTVQADNPSADAPSSMDIADGKSYSFTFQKPGTYSYHCVPHPYMHGTVIVTN